ncbi:MAG: hypothetical protein IKK43_01910 [Clostridia bacterium]|nr:hypothetical protein [Clostridia bacterium]
MNIGIDIDDTITFTSKSMIKYADLYDKNILGKSGINGNFGLITNRYYLNTLYGWDDKTKQDFFNLYYKNILEECEIMPHAVDSINTLKTENNNIYFITARLMKIDNCDTVDITKNTLNDIKYDELIIESDKLKICKEKNIDIFIEDSYDTCKELQLNGIKTYLMTTKMNERIEDEEIERVKSWDELYLKINNYIGSLHNS